MASSVRLRFPRQTIARLKQRHRRAVFERGALRRDRRRHQRAVSARCSTCSRHRPPTRSDSAARGYLPLAAPGCPSWAIPLNGRTKISYCPDSLEYGAPTARPGRIVPAFIEPRLQEHIRPSVSIHRQDPEVPPRLVNRCSVQEEATVPGPIRRDLVLRGLQQQFFAAWTVRRDK